MRPNSLVKHHLGGRDPSFLVVAGIVFTVVTGAPVCLLARCACECACACFEYLMVGPCVEFVCLARRLPLIWPFACPSPAPHLPFLLPPPAPEPYLEAEYGAEYGREAPIKLLDKLLHAWKEHEDQEASVLIASGSV